MDKESMDYANWEDIGLYAMCFIYNTHVSLDYHSNGTWPISSLVSFNWSRVPADILTIVFWRDYDYIGTRWLQPPRALIIKAIIWEDEYSPGQHVVSRVYNLQWHGHVWFYYG